MARPADDHPGRDVEVRDVPALEERERDHAHRLLCVVRAVGERDPRPGRELAEPEAAVRDSRRDPDEEPVDREQESERAREGDGRGDDRRDRHACARGRATARRSSPDWASAAPTSPPISACDELDGRPSHHVIRFQTIAPISAARIVFSFARPVSMIPFPTVFATAVVTKAPARLATAAIENRQARRERPRRDRGRDGVRGVVEAVREVEAERDDHDDDEQDVSTRPAVLDEDRLEHVGRVLERVDGLLEPLVDVFPADDAIASAAREELGDRVARRAGRPRPRARAARSAGRSSP